MRSFFDEKTGVVTLDEEVAATPSFQRILDDGVVTADELAEHHARVVSLLTELDSQLQDEIKGRVRELLVEIGVLYAIERTHETQSLFGASTEVTQ